MSGSNSSVPPVSDPQPSADGLATPVSLTVHRVPLPDTRRNIGRLQMLMVLACCAAPVVASYVTYFFIRPEGRSNFSELIDPLPIPPALPLTRLSGETVAPTSLKGQWVLAVVADGQCDATCENNLLTQTRVREALLREKERVDKVWFVTDDATPSPRLMAAISAGEPTQVFRVPPAELAKWLKPAAGSTLDRHLYLIDPLAQWMLRAPPLPDIQADPKPLGSFKKDIERLLRASASWDKAGRP